MKLLLTRKWYTDRSTSGDLTINDIHEAFSLELARYSGGQENVHQKTCILAGVYNIGFYNSPHNHRTVPILKNVPGRSEIEIHIANKPEDLLGCIGVGQTRSTDWIGGSGLAFDALMVKLMAAQKRGEQIQIEIVNAAEAAS